MMYACNGSVCSPASNAAVTVGLSGVYQYAAQACDAAGCSAWKNANTTTDVEPAGGPQVVQPMSGISQ